jgi:prolyl oligopeptidase
VAAWQDAQNLFAQGHLEALPSHAAFAARLAAIPAADDARLPVHAGGRWFITRVPEGEDLAVVEVADTPTGSGRRVIDLNAMRKDEPLQMQGFIPSPDGRKAVFAWSAGGREGENFQIIEVDTGKVLVDSVPQLRPGFSAWLPDSSGLFYTGVDPAISISDSLVYRLDLGRPAPTEPERLELDHPVPWPKASADRRHLLLVLDHLNPRPHYILDTKGDGAWRPFLKDVPGMFRGDILGDRYIAVTDDGAPNGRLVSIPLATPTRRETWRELVPASDNVLGTLLVAGGRAVLLDLVDTYGRLRVFGPEGDLEGEIALPGRGMVNSFAGTSSAFNIIDCMARGADGQILFLYASPIQSPALCSADVATRTVTQLSEPKIALDAQVLDLDCRSADGARVGYHVIARSDLDLTRPQPTVIYGYGGFNITFLPGWVGGIWAAWIQAGGVLVLAHLRGGGEYGADWWRQGRLKHKQNSFNDVYAVAEDLIERGMATPETLGVIGGSNGGVMAAVVAVQRPDLFRVSVPQVPITDILAVGRDPLTAMICKLDYGDPDDPASARALHAWSPYQNVRDDVAYPAVLVDSGMNDPRCPPWHGRKFAARLQQASASDRPILLRVRAGAGHGTVGKADHDRQSAEVLAFLADQLGLNA